MAFKQLMGVIAILPLTFWGTPLFVLYHMKTSDLLRSKLKGNDKVVHLWS